jgi:hypothetical protein
LSKPLPPSLIGLAHCDLSHKPLNALAECDLNPTGIRITSHEFGNGSLHKVGHELFQPRQPLPGILNLRNTGVGVLMPAFLMIIFYLDYVRFCQVFLSAVFKRTFRWQKGCKMQRPPMLIFAIMGDLGPRQTGLSLTASRKLPIQASRGVGFGV